MDSPAGGQHPEGVLSPEKYQDRARAQAFRPNDDMENVDRLYREDRARYDALPSPVRTQHALYTYFKPGDDT